MRQTTSAAQSKDATLVRRGGDTAAFGELVSRYQGRVWRFLASWVPEPEDREEIVQEVFLAAHRGIGKFRGEARFSTWLLQIAVNQARGHRRKLARRPRLVELPTRGEGEDNLGADTGSEPAFLQDGGADPYEQATRRELQAKVWTMIERLPEEWQSAMRLRYLEEMTHPEIAEVLGVPVGTIKAQLHRGRQRLAEWLAEAGIS